MSAEFSFSHGQNFPYDGDDQNVAREPRDWAVKAARGVLANLTDRRGIKHGFVGIDQDVRQELIDSLAEIIRIAAKDRRLPGMDDSTG